MASTSKPNGLSIARDGGLKFVVSWKVTDRDYAAGQQLRYRVKKSTGIETAWTTVSVASNFQTRSFTIPAASYAPNTSQIIDQIEVQVRGKRSATTQQGRTTTYDWSEWSKAVWSQKAPNRPTVKTDLTASNQTEFSWIAENSGSDNRPFTRTQWQTIIKKACKETDGSKLAWNSSNPGWSTGNGSDTGSQTFTEDTTRLAADSYTRWFRIRSRGAAGNSAWRYAKHVYAKPYKPVIRSTKVTEGSTSTTVVVKWEVQSTAAHPIDDVTLQWAIETPDPGLACPAGASWQDGVIIQDTKDADAAKFTINEVVGRDECLFVRVVAEHDISVNPNNITPSEPALVKKGMLTAPTIISVTTNESTHKATIVAANNSDVTDSKIAVVFRMNGVNTIVAVIDAGETTASGVQCPDWGSNTIAYGLKAFQGTATAKTRADGVAVYTLQKNMYSENVWQSGNVPKEPANVTADAATDALGEVIVTWDWSWADANQAEISWSTNPNAWESTEGPQTYVLDNTYAARWRVTGLETGRTWFFAVRLMIANSDNSVTYGPYSDPVSVDLSTAPNIPILALSAPIVPVTGEITATWEYNSTDGTDQAYAEICECTVNGSTVTYGSVIAHADTARHVTMSAGIWTAGETYYLAVRVTSESGRVSQWSDPIPVYIAEELIIQIDSTSLEMASISDGSGGTRTVTALTEMPLQASILGAGEGGTTTLMIIRADEYNMIRPDETYRNGYEGETIALIRQTGEDAISIGTADLIGLLDDGAKYVLIAMVEDGFGQSDTEEIPFEVHWEHQAGIPTATVAVEDNVACITPAAPSSYAAGDTCDIYRLSADRPQLIFRGAAFGTKYVDPYPTLGEHAGYRCVCVTKNGDYITADNQPAWVDITEKLFDNKTGLIDFDGEQLEVEFNVSISDTYGKDFKETKYLGGSVKGYWNKAISRNSNISAKLLTEDAESIKLVRKLADYPGICHVRTQSGSSYAADVQVSNGQSHDNGGQIEDLSLKITRIEPEDLDGLPYSEWKVS